jgi:hypothetical protein
MTAEVKTDPGKPNALICPGPPVNPADALSDRLAGAPVAWMLPTPPLIATPRTSEPCVPVAMMVPIPAFAVNAPATTVTGNSSGATCLWGGNHGLKNGKLEATAVLLHFADHKAHVVSQSYDCLDLQGHDA